MGRRQWAQARRHSACEIAVFPRLGSSSCCLLLPKCSVLSRSSSSWLCLLVSPALLLSARNFLKLLQPPPLPSTRLVGLWSSSSAPRHCRLGATYRFLPLGATLPISSNSRPPASDLLRRVSLTAATRSKRSSLATAPPPTTLAAAAESTVALLSLPVGCMPTCRSAWPRLPARTWSSTSSSPAMLSSSRIQTALDHSSCRMFPKKG